MHLSDLHFGRTDPAVIEPLIATVHALGPDCVVVSGDLTQRAKVDEFVQARAFLNRLPKPQIVVPGNHDVPLYRVWERVLGPFDNYQRCIDQNLEPSFIDDEIAVFGVNTARAMTFKGGRINEEQIELIRSRFAALPETCTRVIVTHHPFDLPDEPGNVKLVGRARQAMEAFSTCGVDLLLAGHFHRSQAGDTSSRHDFPGYAALAVQAGTATSTRSRGEVNSFNVVRVSENSINVERHSWQTVSGTFQAEQTHRFRRETDRWIKY
ncbi:MAG: metallophosphoesterase family protein [Pseudomonadota bacterium]